ncbi:MAG: hypothetical protein JW955_15040 [Sedimentisphaerales bacterium]|nr:hypothetical protein [Sedimentisphaerales bacterium]
MTRNAAIQPNNHLRGARSQKLFAAAFSGIARYNDDMKKPVTWTIAALILLALALFLGVPYLARTGVPMGKGSYEYARKWSRQLRAYNSPEEASLDFNCFVIERFSDGSSRTTRVGPQADGRPRALVKSFPDGQWIICAHANSHGEPGGGTIVTRDDQGTIHVFFGHVCGYVCAYGDTLDEFYGRVRGYNGVKEVFLDEVTR